MTKIRILLVDDEMTSRNTIKNYLCNHSVYEVTADFSNGKAALKWLQKNHADILLCDMRMPEIDGVELIRCVHIIHEYLPIIAISGFDDFEYVKGSLTNGAVNYLLKHELTRARLIQALDQVKEKYRIVPEGSVVYQGNGHCIYDEKEFTAERLTEMAERGEIEFCCYNVVSIAIGADYKFAQAGDASDYKKEICMVIVDMLNQILRDEYQYVVHVTKQFHLLVLISFSRESSMLMMINIVNNMVGRLQRQISRMLDLTATIVTGEVKGQVTGAIEEAIRLDELLEDRLYFGGNRILVASVAKKASYSTNKMPENLWKQLEFEITCEGNGCVHILQDMFNWMEEERCQKNLVIDNCCRMVKCMKSQGWLKDEEYHAICSRLREYEIFEQFRMEILELFQVKMMEKRKGSGYSPVVNQVIDYVSGNYSSDISLEKCAELTGTNYANLSREFKKETGMRFVEFLNKQRVNRAKSLLIRREVPLKEIANLSGFRNYNYFFKVFKEIEGVTPSEFLTENSAYIL